VLRFEREIVERLVTTRDPRVEREVTTFVEGSLRAMPEFLRFSIGAASIVLGLWALVARPAGTALVRKLDASPIPQIRQYVRLFRSLVLFAEQELA
jgi:hypothetical protein